VDQFLAFTFSGLSVGMIYAAVALALVLIWRATRVVNFAQGAMAMFTTFIAAAVIDHTSSYWLGFVAALGAGLLLGAVLERGVVRHFESGPPLNAVIVTIGLFIALEALAGAIWGGQFQSFPTGFSLQAEHAGSVASLSPFDMFTIGSVLAVALALAFLFQRTSLGLKMRATAFAPEVARLLGVRVGRMLTLGWSLAAVVGSLAGVLVTPLVLLHPANMDGVLVYGFTAAVLGGLESPVGAVVGGVLLGIVLSYVGGYLGSDLVAIGSLGVLVLVLMVRPSGLFGRTVERRV
jgi:branched-chain amino acid transport system permease protein